MGKGNVLYGYHGILFSHKKRNSAICDNIDETEGRYAKSDKLDRKINTAISHVEILKERKGGRKEEKNSEK